MKKQHKSFLPYLLAICLCFLAWQEAAAETNSLSTPPVSFPTRPAIAALTPPPACKIPDCFGVDVHFLDEDLSDQALAEHVRMLKQAGFGWIRLDLRWATVEKENGVFDFSAYDRVVAAMDQAGIGIIFILGYSNPLYDNNQSPASPPALAAFVTFTRMAATRYTDKKIIWELYNEPNYGFWTPQPDSAAYIHFAALLTQLLRQVAPQQPIIGPALSGPVSVGGSEVEKPLFKDFFAEVLASGLPKQWNGITIHPYRTDNKPPETAAADFGAVRALMREYAIPDTIPVIAGEWGYETSSLGLSDESLQAAYAVRTLLWGMMEHMPYSVWYNWQERGPRQDDHEDKYGLLRYHAFYNPKPAFYALSQMSTSLQGYAFDQVLYQQDGIILLSFIKNKQHAYAFWSLDDARHEGVVLPLPQGRWQCLRLLNESTVLTVGPLPPPVTSTRMPTLLTPPSP